METYLDVAVIGASSSGLYAAEQLARAGRRVAVFEQHTSLDPARRTLIVTPQLRHVLGYVPHQAVLHHSQAIALATSGTTATVKLQVPDLIIERRRLAHLLADRAREAGAVINYGHHFQNLEVHPRGAVIHLRVADGEALTVVTRAIIGADGAFSDVAAAADLSRPPTVSILQAEVQLPVGWDAAVTQVWFNAEETRFFYWLIPESAERGVAGLVGDDRAATRALLQHLLDQQGLQPLAYQGAQVALHHPRLRPWGRVGTAPVLLVGDAAGQVKNTTVGGTVTGLWGATAAVRSLVRGTPYVRELRSLKRELDLHWFIRLLLDRLDNPGYQHLLHVVTPVVEQFLGRHNRDQMAGVFWRLLLYQPRILALGLRLLMRRPGSPSHVQTSQLLQSRSTPE